MTALQFLDSREAQEYAFTIETVSRLCSLFFGDEPEHGVVMESLARDVSGSHDFADFEEFARNAR